MANFKLRIPSEALIVLRDEMLDNLGRSVPSFLRAATSTFPNEANDGLAVVKFIELFKTGVGTPEELAAATRYQAAMDKYKSDRQVWLKYYRDMRKL